MSQSLTSCAFDSSLMLMSSIVGDGGSGGTRVAEIYGGSNSKEYYQEGFNVKKVAYVGLRPWQIDELMSSDTLKSNKVPDKVLTDRQRKSIHKQMKSGSRWVEMAYCKELGKARIDDLKFWENFDHTIDTSQFCKVKLFKLLVDCIKATIIHLESAPGKAPEKIKGKNGKFNYPFV